MYPPNVATPTIIVAGLSGSLESASPSPAKTGIPFFRPSRTSPASRPAVVLSRTPRIRYRREYRTRPFAVFPIVRPKAPSQRISALSMKSRFQT